MAWISSEPCRGTATRPTSPERSAHARRARDDSQFPAMVTSLALHLLGWSLGSKRSRSKPQGHDHGKDTKHAGCHENQDAEGVDDGRAAVSGGEQIRVAISPSVDWTEG